MSGPRDQAGKAMEKLTGAARMVVSAVVVLGDAARLAGIELAGWVRDQLGRRPGRR